MINDEYRFNHDAQRSLLAFFVRRPREASSLIQPCYFTSPIHMDIARLAQEAFEGKDLKTDKLTATSLLALVSGYLRKSKPRGAMKHYKKEVQTLFEMDSPDVGFWRDMAQKFSIEVSYRNALVEAERLVNAERYDAASRLFQGLSAKPLAGDSSRKLPFQHLHRFIENADESDPVDDFIVYPIIPKSGSVLLYGLPKELKSWMGVALAMDVAAGKPKALGFFRVPRAAKTMYIQVEDTVAMTRKRVSNLYEKQIGRASKTTLNLKILPRYPLNLMDSQCLAAFEKEIEKFRPEVIILDVFRRLFRGNVMDAKETAEFLQVLDTLRDKYGSAIVLVHHAKKGETPEIQTKALGSINLTGWAEVLMYLCGKQRLGNGSVSNLHIDSKAASRSERQLVIRVDETRFPMVRVLDQERCDIDVLRQCVRGKPGLNQKELMAKSGFGEKKLRPLIQRAIELGLLQEEPGKRKELRYFFPKPR